MNNDMIPELFLSVPSITDYWIPPEPKEYYLDQLDAAVDQNEKIKAIIALIEISRYQRNLDRGFNETICNELIGLLERHGQNPELTERVAGLLMREGAYCEKRGDFYLAIKFYESCLQFWIDSPEYRYYRLNNLAFCMNYMRRFEDAEPLLRQAIEILPEQYNAWKNLGVSLEHQGQIEEAAESYLRAIALCPQNGRAAMHLKRLVERYPALKKVQVIADFVIDTDPVNE